MRPAPPRRSQAGPLSLLLTVLVAVLAGAAPARAAPYDVFSCAGPSGETLPGTAWTPATAGDGATASNDCAAGMRAGLPAGRSNTTASATLAFTAPEGTVVSGYDLARTLRASVGGLFSTGYVASVQSVEPGGTLGASCFGGAFTLPTACVVADPLTASGTALRQIVLGAGCSQATCPSATTTAEAVLARSRVTVEDARAPTAASPSGTLGAMDRVARAVTVPARDVGGGVAAVSAVVDGGSQVSTDTGGPCARPYSSAQPCPAGRDVTFSIDTGAIRPGDHAAAGTITDAAGNVGSWGPVPFTVPSGGSTDPGPAPAGSIVVPVASPDNPAGRLTLSGRSTKTGRRQPTGYLRTHGGTPLAGVEVRLSRTQSGVEAPRTVGLPPVRTGKDGRFVAAALPEGAWTVAGAATITSGTVTGTARLRTGLRLSASPSPRRLRTGGRMVLSGRLTGAGPSKAGARVRIQTIVRGTYTTVATVRTSATGRWRWSYRFKKVSRPTIFAFRAVVPGGGDWPWASVSRRAPSVRVDPR